MIDVRGELSAGFPAREHSQSARAIVRDIGTRDVGTRDVGARDGIARDGIAELAKAAAASRAAARANARLARIAADIVRSVEMRLPGRVRDLKVRVEADQFVLSGVSSSYYVKQVAQHVAMTALEAVMLGRLVNEIEVRTVR